MPIDASTVGSRRVLRLALGTALALFFSQAYGWTLSFIAPVITLSVLALPMPKLPVALCAKLVIAVLVSIYVPLMLLPLIVNYRAVGLLLVALALFHAVYFAAGGGAAVVAAGATIGLTVTVAVGTVSIDGVLAVVNSIAIGALVGVGFAWLAHALLPEIAAGPGASADKPAPPDLADARRSAMRSLLVVLPVEIWLMLSSASAGYAAVMIKVASMGQQASMVDTRSAARSLIISTLAGGIAAVIAWQLLTVSPSIILYTLIVGLAGLFFGARIFQGLGLREDAATWSYAFLTMIVILAPAALDSQFGAAAGAKFFDRLWMFVAATAYAVGVVLLFEVFWPEKKRAREDDVQSATVQDA